MIKHLWSEQIEILSSLTVNSNPSDSSSSFLTSPQNNARRKTQSETLLPEKQPRLRPLFLYLAVSSFPSCFCSFWMMKIDRSSSTSTACVDMPQGTSLQRPWRKQLTTDLLSQNTIEISVYFFHKHCVKVSDTKQTCLVSLTHLRLSVSVLCD